jgi:hypothetical protein
MLQYNTVTRYHGKQIFNEFICRLGGNCRNGGYCRNGGNLCEAFAAAEGLSTLWKAPETFAVSGAFSKHLSGFAPETSSLPKCGGSKN